MNQADTRKALEHYLFQCEKTHRVIALKGAWGTGKTYLWQKIAGEWPEDKPTPIYCSLFGKNSADEVRKALLDETLTAVSSKAATAKKFFGDLVAPVTAAADAFHKGSAVVGQLATGIIGQISNALLQKSIEGRLIVLDDFERRGRDLDVIAILGLIDYLKNRNCRVLFIFNEDQLQDDDAKAFSQFREKVIDVELKLETSPEEACDIATEGRDIPYAEQTHDCFIKLGITNIRVASRTLNVIENIYREYQQLDEFLIENTLQAAITLTVVYFNGIDNTPNFDELKKCIYTYGDFLRIDKFSDEERAARNFYHKFIGYIEHKFVELLVRHLSTGAPLRDEFDAYWKQRMSRLSGERDRQRLRAWLHNFGWNPGATWSSLNQDIVDLLPKVESYLSVTEGQAVYDSLCQIGTPNAEKFLSDFIDHIKNWTQDDLHYVSREMMGQMDKRLCEAIEVRKNELKSVPSLTEVDKAGYFNLQNLDMVKSATREDFEEIFRATEDFSVILKLWEELIKDKDNQGLAAPIIAAAQKILADEPDSRLGWIIRRVTDNDPCLLQKEHR